MFITIQSISALINTNTLLDHNRLDSKSNNRHKYTLFSIQFPDKSIQFCLKNATEEMKVKYTDFALEILVFFEVRVVIDISIVF